jgi:hypothetical protein
MSDDWNLLLDQRNCARSCDAESHREVMPFMFTGRSMAEGVGKLDASDRDKADHLDRDGRYLALGSA